MEEVKNEEYERGMIVTVRDLKVILLDPRVPKDDDIEITMPMYEKEDRDDFNIIKDTRVFHALSDVRSVGIVKSSHPKDSWQPVSLCFTSCPGKCSIEDMLKKSGLEMTHLETELISKDKCITKSELLEAIKDVDDSYVVVFTRTGELAVDIIDGFTLVTTAGTVEDAANHKSIAFAFGDAHDIDSVIENNGSFVKVETILF